MFQRVVAYTPIVAKATGSVKLTILWNQIYYWSDKTEDPDGWIFKTHVDIFQETGLSRKETDTARALGKKIGVLESVVMGTPPKVHYRVDMDAMIEVIGKYLEKHPGPEKRRTRLVVSKKRKKEDVIDLPSWVNAKVWEEWEQYRKEKKKPMTPLARKKAIAFLAGHQSDHVEIIETSIRNSWTGLFPIKRPLPSDDQIRKNERAAAEERARARQEKQDPEMAERVRLTLAKYGKGKKRLLDKMKI